MYKHGEITKAKKKKMRPKALQVEIAHGFPRIHENYTKCPNYPPISQWCWKVFDTLIESWNTT